MGNLHWASALKGFLLAVPLTTLVVVATLWQMGQPITPGYYLAEDSLVMDPTSYTHPRVLHKQSVDMQNKATPDDVHKQHFSNVQNKATPADVREQHFRNKQNKVTPDDVRKQHFRNMQNKATPDDVRKEHFRNMQNKVTPDDVHIQPFNNVQDKVTPDDVLKQPFNNVQNKVTPHAQPAEKAQPFSSWSSTVSPSAVQVVPANNQRDKTGKSQDSELNKEKPVDEEEQVWLTAKFVGGAHRRLGNFLFQFAAMYGIARTNGFKPYLTIPKSIRTDFENITSIVKALPDDDRGPRRKDGRLRVNFAEKDHKGRSFDEEAFHLRGKQAANQGLVVVGGYRQSWKYFHHVWKGDLENQLKCSGDIETRVKTFLQGVLSEKPEGTLLVGMHVRRGDFEKKQEKGYTLSNITYIENAMKYYEQRHSHVAFVVASNGPDWAKKNINSSVSTVVFSPFTAATDDLCLIAGCPASIITGGSYGWWGAYMAGGPVVYDKLFPKPDSMIGRRYTKDDYYPREWVGL